MFKAMKEAGLLPEDFAQLLNCATPFKIFRWEDTFVYVNTDTGNVYTLVWNLPQETSFKGFAWQRMEKLTA